MLRTRDSWVTASVVLCILGCGSSDGSRRTVGSGGADAGGDAGDGGSGGEVIGAGGKAAAGGAAGDGGNGTGGSPAGGADGGFEAGAPDAEAGPGDAGDAAALLTVEPLYPTNGRFWLDYVKDDGADRTHATDTACAEATDGPRYDACIHGGELRRVALPDVESCDGLTASDTLGVFDWICQSAGTGVEFVSTSLAAGKHLTDLLDFEGDAWRPNSVTIQDGDAPIGRTEPEAWWANPLRRVVPADCANDPVGAEHDIFLLDSGSSGALCGTTVGKLGFVAVPGETVTDFGFNNSRGGFYWVEGEYTMTTRFAVFDVGDHGFQVIRNAKFTATAPGSGFSAVMNLRRTRASIVRDVTVEGGRIPIGAQTATGLHISDVTLNGARADAISLDGCTDCTVERATITSPTLNAILLQNGQRFRLREIVTTDPGGGISVARSSNGRIENVQVTRAGASGVSLVSVDHTVVRSVVVDGAAGSGVVTNQANSTDNLLVDIHVGNSRNDGVEVGGARNVLQHARISCGRPQAPGTAGVGVHALQQYQRVQDVTVAGCRQGLYLTGEGITAQGATVVSTDDVGVDASSMGEFIADTVAFDATYGLYFLSNQWGPEVRNFASTDNATGSVYANNSSGFVFGERLIIGASGPTGSSPDCVVPGTPSLTNDCSGTTASVVRGASVLSSFVGKVSDSTNPDGATGTAAFGSITSFTTFASETRRYIRDGDGNFPDYAARGACSGAETCVVYDVALKAADTLLRGVNTLPTGNDVVTHAWVTSVVPADQAACDARVPGSAFVAGTPNRCESVFLNHAWELVDDAAGDDDGFCESNETCEYAPNIGGYQGHGPLVSAGAFTDGRLVGITLMRRQTNGY